MVLDTQEDNQKLNNSEERNNDLGKENDGEVGEITGFGFGMERDVEKAYCSHTTVRLVFVTLIYLS